MKATIKQVKAGFQLTVKSTQHKTIAPLKYVAATREQCEAEQAGFESLMAEFDAQETRKIARARYIRALEKAEALQAAYPGLYLVDEAVAIENATDGLKENHNIDISGMPECDWPAIAFDVVTANLIDHTAQCCAENEIDGAPFGFTF
jgi:hypothetical protein